MSISDFLGRIAQIAGVAALGLVLAAAANADNRQKLDSIHFLIPGGAGGGWDGTARGTGEALKASGLIGSASYENMSGGGGGKAIAYLIENADSNHGTLMVNSTPIVIRSLIGRFPQNFRDLTMIAGTIGDYAALIVAKDSPIKDFKDLLAKFKNRSAVGESRWRLGPRQHGPSGRGDDLQSCRRRPEAA